MIKNRESPSTFSRERARVARCKNLTKAEENREKEKKKKIERKISNQLEQKDQDNGGNAV